MIYAFIDVITKMKLNKIITHHLWYVPWWRIHRKMYSSGHHQNQQPTSNSNSAFTGPSNSTGNSGSSAGLPPLLLNTRLHELVIAGTGQNERLEPALEHVYTID
jgi:hypothetical protein